MKKIVFVITVIFVVFQIMSCSMAETMSTARHYNISLKSSNNDVLQMFVHKGAGEYTEILPEKNVYSVDIEAMGGGYSKFLWIKFNQHIPEEYDVVKVMKGEQILQELSIVDIEKLNKDNAGNYVMTF